MHCHSFHGARHHFSVLPYSVKKNDLYDVNQNAVKHSHTTDIVDADAYLCVKGLNQLIIVRLALQIIVYVVGIQVLFYQC